jgi:hypothetical protein
VAAINVAWVPVQGIWVRQTIPGRTGTEASASDARWQRAATPAAYFGDGEETVWAEFYRALAERGVAPQDALPRDLHHILVRLDRVADLRTERSRRALGLPRIRPTSRQWPAFQRVGEALADQRAQGILYSSSARTRSACLCVFEPGLAGLRVEGDPVRVIAPPPPPRGLRT